MATPKTTHAQLIISERQLPADAEYSPESFWVSIRVLMLAAALGGVWGLICLINGLTAVSCVQELGRVLITACTGSI